MDGVILAGISSFGSGSWIGIRLGLRFEFLPALREKSECETLVKRDQIKPIELIQLESLILAQNERWRQA